MAYIIEQTLYQQSGISIYRVKNKEQLFIAKSVSSELPTISEIEALKREYETIAQFKSPYIVEAKEFASFNNSQAIIMVDFGGQSLDKILQEKNKLSFAQKLKISQAVCQALMVIHPGQAHLKVIEIGLT